MSFERCDKCDFLYENINFCPCPVCQILDNKCERTQCNEWTDEEENNCDVYCNVSQCFKDERDNK